MNCPNCGTPAAAGQKFCMSCGGNITAGTAAAAAAGRKADVIDYEIIGAEMQAVVITLDPQEGVRSESGAMLYMEDGIEMSTGATGGIWKGIKRAFTGESFFQTTFTNTGARRANIAFAAPYPGKIIPLDLSVEREYLCQKEAFLCAANGVDLDIAFTKKLGAGFFGGEGFILQRIKGDGLAFIHAGGTIIERTLTGNESLRVDTGCLVAFQPSVAYDIKFIGGFKNVLFGGEGLFYAVLRGPGKVYLQTLPFSKLADRIFTASKMASTSTGESKGSIAGVLGGGILGAITNLADSD
jgi:uncharacterized protein (TIGR00266 family)